MSDIRSDITAPQHHFAIITFAYVSVRVWRGSDILGAIIDTQLSLPNITFPIWIVNFPVSVEVGVI